MSVWGSSKTSLVVLGTWFDPYTLVLPAPVGFADGVITLPIKCHGGLAKPFSGSQSSWNAFIAYSRRSGFHLKKRGIWCVNWMQTDPHTVVQMLPWGLRWLKGKASSLICHVLSAIPRLLRCLTLLGCVGLSRWYPCWVPTSIVPLLDTLPHMLLMWATAVVLLSCRSSDTSDTFLEGLRS